MPRAALAVAGLLSITACDEWHLSINSQGLVFISVTGSPAEPRHRFRVRTRDPQGSARTVEVPGSGQLTLTTLAGGTHELTLLTPEICRVSGSNPQLIETTAGAVVRLEFDVRCD
jgi:hypothetical protein